MLLEKVIKYYHACLDPHSVGLRDLYWYVYLCIACVVLWLDANPQSEDNQIDNHIYQTDNQIERGNLDPPFI